MGKESLTEYAASHPVAPPGFGAWIESIPEFPEVLKGWQDGISQSQIRRWLIEVCGYDPQLATRNRLSHLSKQYPRAKHG